MVFLLHWISCVWISLTVYKMNRDLYAIFQRILTIAASPASDHQSFFFGCVFSFSHNRSKWLAMQRIPNSQASSVSSAWHIYCIRCLWDLLSLCVCVCRKIFTKSRSCKDCRSFISIQTKPGFFIWHDIIDLVQTTNNKRRIPKRNGFLFSYKRIGSDEFISEQT